MSEYCRICFNKYEGSSEYENKCLTCDIIICNICIKDIIKFNNNIYLYSDNLDFTYCSLYCVYKQFMKTSFLSIEEELDDILKGENSSWIHTESIYNHQTKLLKEVHIKNIRKILNKLLGFS